MSEIGSRQPSLSRYRFRPIAKSRQAGLRPAEPQAILPGDQKLEDAVLAIRLFAVVFYSGLVVILGGLAWGLTTLIGWLT